MLNVRLGKKIKSISKDFILNLIASFIATGVLQILVYPILAKLLDANSYGVLLTMMGIANTIAAGSGGSLNNTRLLMNREYEDKNIQGDFIPLLIIMNVVSILGFGIGCHYFDINNPSIVILLVIYVVLSSSRSYASVAFRIVINYKKILISNLLVAFGNVVGVLFLYYIKGDVPWPLPFCIGELLGIVYIIVVSDILREPVKITYIWKRTCSKEFVLVCTTLAGNLLIYLDRLLLLPLLGGRTVTIYTVASVFGKSLGVLMAPLAGVLLTYFVQRDFEMTVKVFWKLNLSMLGVAFGFTMASVVMANWFTAFLYPTVVEEASKYILVANVAAIVGVVANMTQPAVLRFAPTYWQLIIQVIYCVLYLGGGVIVANVSGLKGFSVVAGIAAIFKVILLYIIGHKYIRLNQRVEKNQICSEN